MGCERCKWFSLRREGARFGECRRQNGEGAMRHEKWVDPLRQPTCRRYERRRDA